MHFQTLTILVYNPLLIEVEFDFVSERRRKAQFDQGMRGDVLVFEFISGLALFNFRFQFVRFAWRILLNKLHLN